jgi:hypothetical protein
VHLKETSEALRPALMSVDNRTAFEAAVNAFGLQVCQVQL